MQLFIKKISLVLFVLTSFISCSKDKEESNGKIETSPVSTINFRSAKTGGVISASTSAIIQRGVCYSTTPNPDITKTITKDGKDLGTFTSYLGQLTANTKYYLRAYMVNGSGTLYGNEITFTTPDYPTENIWNLSDNIYVVNDQNVITKFQWKDSTFFGIDNSLNENNIIFVKFKQKPTATNTYKLVNKTSGLSDDECTIKVTSARNPYIGVYSYTSATPQNITVQLVNNKVKITIPTVEVFEANDINSTIPVSFKAVLIEK